MDQDFVKPEVDLSTCNGNIYAIMGRCTKALKRADLSEKAQELQDRVKKCRSYDDALQVCLDYVDAY